MGYDLIKQLHKHTEDHPEPEYFALLQQAFEALDDKQISLPLIQFWFEMQLLRLGGHSPNLQTDVSHRKLAIDHMYRFDYDAMAFAIDEQRGTYAANHIKFLRLALAGHTPQILRQVQGCAELLRTCTPLLRAMKAH
jgi:recombinational DNA repair protein (RecF pathway)